MCQLKPLPSIALWMSGGGRKEISGIAAIGELSKADGGRDISPSNPHVIALHEIERCLHWCGTTAGYLWCPAHPRRGPQASSWSIRGRYTRTALFFGRGRVVRPRRSQPRAQPVRQCEKRGRIPQRIPTFSRASAEWHRYPLEFEEPLAPAKA